MFKVIYAQLNYDHDYLTVCYSAGAASIPFILVLNIECLHLH